MRGAGGAVYGLHGLQLRSPVALAGRPLPAGSEHDVDIRVREGRSAGEAGFPPGRLLVAWGEEEAYRYAGAEAGGEVTLRVPGVCDFLIGEELRSVECRRAPGVDDALVGLLLGGLVVSFLLALRGEYVLHASAVELGGRAIAFAGRQGSGKSTLAALMCASGGRLVTDDVLRVTAADGPRCVRGAPQVRIRSAAGWVVRRFDRPPPSEPTVDGRVAITPPQVSEASVPLAAIVVPHLSREATRVRIRAVAPVDAVPQLMALSRVIGWRDAGVTRRQFEAAAALANDVRVVEAEIPWGEAVPASLVPELAALARL